MKKHILLIILLPFIGLSQSYTITQQPTYGQDPKYTPTTYKVNQTSTTTAPNIDFGAMASRAIDTYKNRRIENERQQREYLEKNRLIELEKKKLQEEKRLEEEKDPNSILNKFKSSKLKKENEDLKIKVLQMEMILAEKEKADKEKAEIDRLEKERIERENSLKKNLKINK